MTPQVFDAHLDLTYDLIRKQGAEQISFLNRDYLESFEKGNVVGIVAAVYLEDYELGDNAFNYAIRHIDALYREIQLDEKYALYTNAADFKSGMDSGRLGFFLSLEGVEPVGEQLSRIDDFYNRGVRLMGLTWSRDNLVACGSHFEDSDSEAIGLTPYGFEFLKEVEKRSIILDVSHLNEQGFWDVMTHYGKPLIASHSNCRSINNITRNLSDAQIQAIGDKGGVIGVNGSSIIISDNDDDVTIQRYVDHIDHIVDLIGVDHVGFGFDLCNRIRGYLGDSILGSFDRSLEDFIEDHSGIPAVIDELTRRGYSEEAIEKITFGNFFRIIEQILE